MKKLSALVLIVFLTACTSPNSVLFVGDTHFGESYNKTHYESSLENFTEILTDSDLVIANLETPLTDIEESPFEGEKTYIHYSDPVKASQVYRDHNMHTFSLANNHSMDFGEAGLEQTLKTGFEFFGTEKKPYIDRNFIVVGAYDKKVENINYLDTEQIRELQQKYPEKLIIVFPHWGENYKMIDSLQEQKAHELIDAGADLIIGHGAHMMQEIDQYKGKWIVYSLGNFVFNSPGRYESQKVDPISLIASLEGSTLKLYPIFTDNKITNYKSRFVTEEEFKNLNLDFEQGKDKYGLYIALDLL